MWSLDRQCNICSQLIALYFKRKPGGLGTFGHGKQPVTGFHGVDIKTSAIVPEREGNFFIHGGDRKPGIVSIGIFGGIVDGFLENKVDVASLIRR